MKKSRSRISAAKGRALARAATKVSRNYGSLVPALDRLGSERSGAKVISFEDLKRDPKNARRHNERNLAMIENSLREVGAARSGVIDEHGRILAGNGTYEALKAAGIERIKVVETDGKEWVVVQRKGLTEEQKRTLALADNRTGELATWDPIALQNQGLALSEWFSAAELKRLEYKADEQQAEPAAQPDAAAELNKKWKVARGQLWEIPSAALGGRTHRLACGDSTDKGAMAALMGRDKAALVFTDPPYGVSYESSSGKFAGIRNDAKRMNELSRFLTAAFSRMVEHTRDGAAFYIWHASQTRDDFAYALKAAGIIERQYIIWVKPSFVMAHADYQWNHEPCFYASRGDKAPTFYGDRSQVTVWTAGIAKGGRNAVVLGQGLILSDGGDQTIHLAPKGPKNKKLRHLRIAEGQAVEISAGTTSTTAWEIGRDTNKALHPTQKPVALASIAIGNSSMIGDIVLDSFVGAGTTLVACEQLARIGHAMDDEPKFCAVTLERMSELGLKPELAKGKKK